MTADSYNEHCKGKVTYGRTEGDRHGQFVVPTPLADAIEREIMGATDKGGALCKLLSIKPEWSGEMVRVDIPSSRFFGPQPLSIRMPTSKDPGVNLKEFVLGGITKGGACEAYINQLFDQNWCSFKMISLLFISPINPLFPENDSTRLKMVYRRGMIMFF